MDSGLIAGAYLAGCLEFEWTFYVSDNLFWIETDEILWWSVEFDNR